MDETGRAKHRKYKTENKCRTPNNSYQKTKGKKKKNKQEQKLGMGKPTRQ